MEIFSMDDMKQYKKIYNLFLLLLLLISIIGCSKLIYNESEYDCGVVVGGELRGNDYYLLVSYPDGEFFESVTEKAYNYYNMFDEICFDTIIW